MSLTPLITSHLTEIATVRARARRPASALFDVLPAAFDMATSA